MKSKYLKFALLSATVCFLQINIAKAQGVNPCGTVENNEKMYLQHPELRQAYVDYFNSINQKVNQKEGRSTTLYTIPIVFHVIHINGTENIPDANIVAQVAAMNADFAKLNSDYSSNPPYFQAIGGDALIQFKLAKIDPNGNCTNGIDRIYSHRTVDADDNSKLNPWPRDKYFNVWVITNIPAGSTPGTILAYATFPSSVNTFGAPWDGVIMISSECNGSSTTLTHEAGHWLGLEHTWGNTQVATACGDDGVNDTPITKGHFSTCPAYDFVCENATLTASYAFSSVTTASGSTDPSTNPSVSDSTLTLTSFMANGVSSNSVSANIFDFTGWDTGALDGETSYAGLTGAINAGKYYEFKVKADTRVLMSLTGITFDFKRDSAGARTFAVRSSKDNYTSNLAASITPANPNLSLQTGNVFFSNFDSITTSQVGCKITLSGASFTGVTDSITFRIYGYNAESAVGSFGIDNVVLSGTYGDAENITNYMDYSSCTYMFTQGQIDRMRATAESPVAQRSSLWITSNLIATGTDGSTYPPCAPATDFYADDYMICPGANIAYTPNVLNLSQGSSVNYAWTFPGGTPSASTSASPVVVYNTAGGYDVTLTVTSGTQSTTVTKTNFINVSDNFAQVSNTFSESFENPASFYSLWDVNDLDNNGKTWWINSSAAYTGSRSIMMNGYYNYPKDVDELISPSFNLTYISSAVLTFRCAAATQATDAADITDNLRVYSSNDCGASWQLRSPTNISGAGTGNGDLINNSYHPEEFVPNSSSPWTLHTIAIPATFATANTRFKFEYTSGDANNSVYIDDINMTGVLNVSESTINGANVSIFPNPTNQTSTLYYHLNKKGDTKIELIDVLGKKIMEVNNGSQTEGDYSVQISKSELNLLNGIYFVKFTIDNTTITKKLIITE